MATLEPSESRRARTEALRGSVQISAYGAPDGARWARQAVALGGTHMRVTNLFEESTAQAAANGGDKLGEMDNKVRAAVDAGFRIVVDFSYYRNLLIKEKTNPYFLEWPSWLAPMAQILDRQFPGADYDYAHAPEVAAVALSGEPDILWGDDNPVQRAGSADQYLWAIRQQVIAVRKLDYDGPVTAGGFNHLNSEGPDRGAYGDAVDRLAGVPWVDALTFHGYDEPEKLRSGISKFVDVAQSGGKLALMEECGFNSDNTADAARAAKFRALVPCVAASGLAGLGLWNVGEYNGYDVRATHPEAMKAWNEVVASLPVLGRAGVAAPAGGDTPPVPPQWATFSGDATPGDTFIASMEGSALCVGPRSEWGTVTVPAVGQKRLASVPPAVLGGRKPQRVCYPLLKTDGTSDGSVVEVWPNSTVVTNVVSGGGGKRICPMMYAPLA
nr:MAG TPA: Endoglucanase EG-II [Caudoviricetes sp.]